MFFSEAQTFLVDPSSVAGATEVCLTKVRLFFKSKPSANNNKSGIENPGVSLFVVPTSNGVPVLDNIETSPVSRVEYDGIETSPDAKTPTDFRFTPGADVVTGNEWALIIKFDGDEDFVTWKSKQGETLVGSNTTSPGPSRNYVGKYYDYISSAPTANTPSVNNGIVQTSNNIAGNTTTPNTTYTSENWRPLNDTDLKFQVYVARYRVNGSANLAVALPNNIPADTAIVTPTTNVVANSATNISRFVLNTKRYEYVAFDRRTSKRNEVRLGERCWNKVPFYPNNKTPARISFINGSLTVTANGFNFNDIFKQGVEDEYIVLYSALSEIDAQDGQLNDRVALRRVVSVESNTSIRIDVPAPFTNTNAMFYKPPVAHLHDIGKNFISGKYDDFAILVNSNANSSNRFVNNSIESFSILTPGTGYSNTDYIILTGYENVSGRVLGGYPARALITTNGSGAITNVHMANLGAGYVYNNLITPTVYAANGASSNGTGALFGKYDVDSTILFEQAFKGRYGYIRGCKLLNIDVNEVYIPNIINNPVGTFFNLNARYAYHKVRDLSCFGGWRYHLDDFDRDNDYLHIVLGQRHRARFSRQRVVCSWSNELVITYAQAGTVSNGAGTQANNVVADSSTGSNATVITINTASNGDFQCIHIPPSPITMSKYVINNDYTNEHTNYGNAVAKGVTKKVNFANDYISEDLKVFLTAYRPANTDLKVYARIHNSKDPEAFDDKDWTLMVPELGIGRFSSQTNSNDYIELSYGFPQTPNSAYVVAGTITTTLGNTTITGSGTNFTANLAVNDVVKITQPLFKDNHMVALVTAIGNTTSLTLNRPIANNNLVGPGLKIEKIGFKNQAFNNIMNENVVRYYSSSLIEYDGFDTMQFKIVFLSDDETYVPRVDDIRATGVSA